MLDFNETRDVEVAVASAGPCRSLDDLLTVTTRALHQSIFWILFITLSQ